MRIKVLEGQTIFDVAVRYYGGIDGVVNLKELNPTVVTSYEVELEPGTELEIGTPVKQEVVDEFDARNLQPASGALFPVGDSESIGVYGTEYSNEYD